MYICITYSLQTFMDKENGYPSEYLIIFVEHILWGSDTCLLCIRLMLLPILHGIG